MVCMRYMLFFPLCPMFHILCILFGDFVVDTRILTFTSVHCSISCIWLKQNYLLLQTWYMILFIMAFLVGVCWLIF